MKSPAELKIVLRRQWENGTRREMRLLGTEDAWPVVIPIGRPSPRLVSDNLDNVKRHVDVWRRVRVGEVVWEAVAYRATTAPVDVPVRWKLRKPTEWIDACADQAMRYEFESLAELVERTDPVFHSTIVRRRSLWRGKPLNEIAQAARLALSLVQGCAAGRPLRMLSLEGIDTKFFERHAHLVTVLLDSRFDGEVSKIGLEVFLGAVSEGDHWLLVMDLDGSLLPFRKQRVRSSELHDARLAGDRLLIVENESCHHQLPDIPKTIAVLGAGFDLGWMNGCRLAQKKVAYWGDIDTWGLRLLGKARRAIGQLDALMMTSDVFAQNADCAVPEPVVAGNEIPLGLTPPERVLYRRLLEEPRGRLEQEFLPAEFVRATLMNWADGCPTTTG